MSCLSRDENVNTLHKRPEMHVTGQSAAQWSSQGGQMDVTHHLHSTLQTEGWNFFSFWRQIYIVNIITYIFFLFPLNFPLLQDLPPTYCMTNKDRSVVALVSYCALCIGPTAFTCGDSVKLFASVGKFFSVSWSTLG